MIAGFTKCSARKQEGRRSAGIILRVLVMTALATGLVSAARGEAIELKAETPNWVGTGIPGAIADADCFSVEAVIDPVVARGGDLQVVAGVSLGLPGADAVRTEATVNLDLREGGDRSAYVLWHRKRSLTVEQPDPQPAGWVDTREFQHPNEMAIRDGFGHRVRLTVWPVGAGSRIRVFIDAMDRPVEEWLLNERITAGHAKLFTLRGGRVGGPVRKSRFTGIVFRQLTVAQAKRLPAHWETVLGALDLSYPPLAPVARAIEEDHLDEARSLFLQHMGTRTNPPGPTWERVNTVLHPDYRKISKAALNGEYGTIGYFDGFVDAWTDTTGATHRWVLRREPLQLNWARDNGYLNRHFHWVSLAKTWDETGDRRFAKRFSDEVFDWVSREPFFWDRCPTIGGLNIMDGTTFRRGYMNTSNIGRRLELTWWPAYEVFRGSRDFSEAAHFAMLVGMIRQAELITNPSSFAVHDDGAAHTTMALIQTALMLPEFRASARWKVIALARWDEMLAKQFHPDGSHVSLSLGYNWATLLSLENFIRLVEQLGGEPPRKYLDILERALEHPMLLSTPGQGMIPLNDAGWGLVDDKYRSAVAWFPAREDFKWMATKGNEGKAPTNTSLYFPNAGQYVMRTGWGPEEQYLFFGAGPWGASHGKQDALNIFAQFGHHALIRDAGRGSYSGIGHTRHAGRSLSYNTLSPDWAQENSIPHWRAEMHVGFHPPQRRWVSNADFDFGEGVFSHGWYNSKEHIQGRWLRQVIFVKGDDPRRTGYHIVMDTVEPADAKTRTWRHPWQLNPDAIQIRAADRSVVATTRGAALQILPVDPAGDLRVAKVQGQVTPELLGWRIYDKTAKPWPVPTYSWSANQVFCRAWVIQMQANQSDWPVLKVEPTANGKVGELKFKIHLRKGGVDHVLRRFPGRSAVEFDQELVRGDVVVHRRDRHGTLRARLETDEGMDSVARPARPIAR